MQKLLSLVLSIALLFSSVSPSLAEGIELGRRALQTRIERRTMQARIEGVDPAAYGWIKIAAQAVGSASGEQVIQYAAGKLREA
ncbi:MAG: hypothetical protein J6X06_06360, partial [Elusimicrobiaceae bacterium]|nr:hypothetical protein [Elusimicrobiaceae bacterium]